MKILINNLSMVPIYEQVYEQIKNQILDKLLPPGDFLPSVRKLSASLNVSYLTIKKSYDNISMDLSLHINKGEIVLLVGKNASGKTSSIKLLLGVNEIDYGSIELDGEKIQKVDKEKFGFVLQDLMI
ncbi:MAG: GntR family transcriptional regulator [Peptoniphilaceae bacterium]|nr:GntR family transcriptional regulator [Peptoniphilaceae bacterium]MDY6019555.1 GntR family transcriptional regulator [Anaerococcus sp.]